MRGARGAEAGWVRPAQMSALNDSLEPEPLEPEPLPDDGGEALGDSEDDGSELLDDGELLDDSGLAAEPEPEPAAEPESHGDTVNLE